MDQKNADIKVKVAPDGMSAVLLPVPARQGGRGGVAKLLQQALIEAGVRKGTDAEALKKAFALLAAGRPVPETVVARGLAPDAAKAARVEYLVSLKREDIGTRDDATGHIDFRDKGGLPQVKEGQELARLIPTQEGGRGYTVTGRSLDPEQTVTAVLEAGKNVIREGDTLIAGRDGLLAEVQPGRLAVLEILDLEEVGNDSGHIEFSGLVRVRGGVAGGYKVKAESLEAANLEAETLVEVRESVTIRGPVLGATVRAGGRVECTLLRRSEVECGGDLVVANEIVESKVRAGGKILLGSPQGRIVNSELSTGRGIEAGQVVSKGKTPSQVTLGLKKAAAAEPDPAREELVEQRADLAVALQQVEAQLKEWGLEWRRTKDSDLAGLIRQKGALLKDLRERLQEVEAELEKTGDAESQGARDEGGAYLSVRHSADPGLIIKGRKAVLTLDRSVQAFSAKEILRTNPETGREEWVIEIFDARISP